MGGGADGVGTAPQSRPSIVRWAPCIMLAQSGDTGYTQWRIAVVARRSSHQEWSASDSGGGRTYARKFIHICKLQFVDTTRA